MSNSDTTHSIYKVLSLTMPLIGVVVGSLLTVYLTREINDELWEKQNISSQQKNLVEKRINLIERASKILNSKQSIEDVNMYLKTQSSYAEEAVNCAKNFKEYNMTIAECKNLVDLEDTFQKMKLKNDLNSEFGSLLQLTSLYFGNKTKKFSQELSKHPKWWEADMELFSNYITAMNEELYEFTYQKMPNRDRELLK